MAALLACTLAVMWMVGPYLLALFLGGTLAMLAYPLYHWLLAEAWSRRAAAFSVTTLMLLLVIAPIVAFSILALTQGIAMGQQLAQLDEFSPKAMTVVLSRWQWIRAVIGDPRLIDAWLRGMIQAAGTFASSGALKLIKGLPEFSLQIILSVLSFFFALLDGERFMNWLLGLGALDKTVQERLVEAFRTTTISAVLAGLAAAASLAVMISAGFLALGVPGAFLAGGLTFVFAWIPLLGTAPALLAGMLYLYAQGSMTKLGIMAALGLAASVVDHLIRPLVLKGRAGMHPLVGLVAIISGIRLFGLLGVFIGPILAAMLLSLLKIWPVVGDRFGIGSMGDRPNGKVIGS
jgi:predicted PurR-regulated permease PerM